MGHDYHTHGPACIAIHCSHLYITNPGSVSHFPKTWVSIQTTTYERQNTKYFDLLLQLGAEMPIFPSKAKPTIFWSCYSLSPVKIWVCNSTSDIFKTTTICFSPTEKYKLHPKSNKMIFSKCSSAVSDKVTHIDSVNSSDIHSPRAILAISDICQKISTFKQWKIFYILIIDFSKISRSTFSQSGTFCFRLLPNFFDI